MAIITTSALTAGRAIYAGDSEAAAERALRVWFAVFATEQRIVVEVP